jgi:hypothetical protein
VAMSLITKELGSRAFNFWACDLALTSYRRILVTA